MNVNWSRLGRRLRIVVVLPLALPFSALVGAVVGVWDLIDYAIREWKDR